MSASMTSYLWSFITPLQSATDTEPNSPYAQHQSSMTPVRSRYAYPDSAATGDLPMTYGNNIPPLPPRIDSVKNIAHSTSWSNLVYLSSSTGEQGQATSSARKLSIPNRRNSLSTLKEFFRRPSKVGLANDPPISKLPSRAKSTSDIKTLMTTHSAASRQRSPPSPKKVGLFPKRVPLEPLELRGRYSETPPVVNIMMANKIRKKLPVRLRHTPTWELLYSLDQHGISLTTLFSRVAKKGPCLLAVKAIDGAIFGAFVSEPFKPNPTFFGTGESFLWKYNPLTQIAKVFEWTGANEYIMMCEANYISVGGGDGTYGLRIDATLLEGFSNRCPTFGNEILSTQKEFEVANLEVWGLQP